MYNSSSWFFIVCLAALSVQTDIKFPG